MTVEGIKKRIYPKKKNTKVDIPKDNWVKCNKCKEIIYKRTYEKNMKICPYCNYHSRMEAWERIKSVTDTFEEFNIRFDIKNPLKIAGYKEKIKSSMESTGLSEACLCGIGTIKDKKSVICAMDSNFIMGSMGSIVGELITYSIEYAIKNRLPLIIFSASGGARMQEGILSLMQMAKTSSALTKLDSEGLLYISVLTDPTYGGVTASFATLGDVILSEPGTMIGFAGPNVIKQTIGEELPEGFQTAEFMLEHGFIDKIVERTVMKETLYKLLKIHEREYE